MTNHETNPLLELAKDEAIQKKNKVVFDGVFGRKYPGCSVDFEKNVITCEEDGVVTSMSFAVAIQLMVLHNMNMDDIVENLRSLFEILDVDGQLI